MCIAGMTMLKSAAEVERPPVELVTYPFTAPKVLVSRAKSCSLSKAGQASCKKSIHYGTHTYVHAAAASVFDASL